MNLSKNSLLIHVAALAFTSTASVANAFLAPVTLPTAGSNNNVAQTSTDLNLYIDHDDSTNAGPVTMPKRKRLFSRRRSNTSNQYLHQVTNSQELTEAVQSSSSQDEIVVVRFHAPYCPACKQIAVAYENIARTHSKKSSANDSKKIKFVDVKITDQLQFADFEVPATPYAHIYQNGKLLEHNNISRAQLGKFKNTLNWYIEGQAELPQDFFDHQENYEWNYDQLQWSV